MAITFDNPDTVAIFEADFSDAVTFHGLDESHREIFRNHWAMNPHWLKRADRVEHFASFARQLKDARDPDNPLAKWRQRSAATVPTSATVPPPDTLTKEGVALYKTVEEHSLANRIDWFAAFGKVTGNPEYASPRPVPRPPGEATDETDRLAQEIQRSHAIGYLEAAELVRHTKELAEAKKDPEPSEVPWLDTRPLSVPPRPWSDEDWERDSRRAAAADVALVFEEWKANAELGRDVVGEQAQKARAERVAELETWGERLVRGAQETEAKLRTEAIEGELDRRAKSRLKGRGLAR